MTDLFDVTIQHLGWSGSTFANGGWEDLISPNVTGLNAVSFWCQSLNGQAIDQAPQFHLISSGADLGNFVNIHSALPQQGNTVPSPFLVTPDVQLRCFTRTPSSTGAILWRVVVSDQGTTPPPTTPACQYGTQTQSSAPNAIVITAPLIETVLASTGLEVLAVALAPIVGLSIGIQNLCAAAPPIMPTLDSNLSLNSVPTLLQAFSSAAWPYFCQCTPGTPPPINFPAPTFTPPPQWPAAPTFACDPTDLCTTLSAIEQLLNQVSGTVSSNYALTTLLQRYQLPFAVIPSTFHNSLTGEGSISVSRLVGMGYQVNQLPPNVDAFPGVPTYLRNLGWMGWSQGGVMLAERRIARQQEYWLPPEAAMADTFGWNLTPGTEISLRELLAEP